MFDCCYENEGAFSGPIQNFDVITVVMWAHWRINQRQNFAWLRFELDLNWGLVYAVLYLLQRCLQYSVTSNHVSKGLDSMYWLIHVVSVADLAIAWTPIIHFRYRRSNYGNWKHQQKIMQWQMVRWQNIRFTYHFFNKSYRFYHIDPSYATATPFPRHCLLQARAVRADFNMLFHRVANGLKIHIYISSNRQQNYHAAHFSPGVGFKLLMLWSTL